MTDERGRRRAADAFEIVGEVKAQRGSIPVAVKAGAAPHRLRPLRQARSTSAGADGLVPLHALSPRSTSTSTGARGSPRRCRCRIPPELPLRLRGAAALAGARQGVDRDHRRRSHRARRHQGDDGRCATRRRWSSALLRHGPATCARVRREISNRGCRSTSGRRSPRCAAT